MAKWLLIDGFNLAFRSYYGVPELTRKDGFPTNAIHGWIRTLWRLHDDEQPDHMLVFYDLGGSDKRLALLPEYKMNRSQAPEAFSLQIAVIKELTLAMGYGQIEQEGIEADDLIAAYASQLSAKGDEALIVSADKDLAQCVEPGITQLLPPPTANPKLGWRKLDVAGVEKKFNVGPDKIPAYLALTGDSSDNIPGLPGVGPKTASKWLNQYGSLEKIIANCGRLKPTRFQMIVHQNASLIRRNLELTTLECEHCIDTLEAPVADPEKALKILKDMEMNRAHDDALKRL